jgi:hypothetical protein
MNYKVYGFSDFSGEKIYYIRSASEEKQTVAIVTEDDAIYIKLKTPNAFLEETTEEVNYPIK